MYDLKIDVGRNSVHLSPDYGYYVSTIDGLTGISASFDTVKAINGYGESITSKTIPPKNLVITGVILDKNTTAKQAMLNCLLAGEEGVITIYQDYMRTSGSSRPSMYRRAKVFVKNSPIITQEQHSKFSFTLTMPNPYWEDVTEQTITVSTWGQSAPQLSNILGDVPPEYSFEYTASANSHGASLYCGASLLSNIAFYFDYTKLTDGYLPAGSTVKLWRENGRLRLTRTDNNVINQNIIEAAYTNSSLWYLPVGNGNRYWLNAEGGFTNAKIKYRPLYSGVLVDGV